MKKLILSLFVILSFAGAALAQDRTVTGTVTAKEDGLPLPGVSVRVKGTSVGTSTGANGKFTISVPASGTILQLSFIGYTTVEAPIPSNGVITASLTVDSKQQLNEVVVTAGGIESRRKEQGTASTTVKAASINATKPVNLVAGLNGKAPGLRINATSSGVNPNYRVILRGMRSLTGNNEALIVLNNVIVPNALLGNINPEDIEDIQILNGAGAAALYGSEGSNGALIITTKKGVNGVNRITVSNTTTIEQVSFYPKLQNKFGSGSTPDLQEYLAYENQQYGPAFDGSIKDFGRPLEDGSIQRIPYSANDSKNDFWKNGLTNITDFSLTSGDDNSTIYLSGRYSKVSGTTPGDDFNMANVNINGTRKIIKNLGVTYAVGYTQNRYDITTATATLYDQLLNTPAQAPLTSYKDWRNNPFANPNGYFNAYYNNPYFVADNNRELTRNDYLTGSTEVKYTPLKWLDVTYRLGITARNTTRKRFVDKFAFTDFTKEQAGGPTYKAGDINGSNEEYSYYQTRLVNDLLFSAKHTIGDFKFNATVAGQIRNDIQKDQTSRIDGLVVPGLFNLSNSTSPATANSSQYNARQQAIYGFLNIGYKDYLFLNLQGRNDWVSILAPENRSFFYPAANLSFVATEAIPALQDIQAIDFIKLRAGISKIGQVNLGQNFGAYQLDPTFGQAAGYPYNGQGGFTLNNTIVSDNLKPEITKSIEFGFDANFLNNRIATKVTYFSSKTDDQTVVTGVSSASGYSAYRVNVGETSSKGLETSLALTALRTADWEVTVGGNYTYLKNDVNSISADLERISLAAYGGAGGAGSYAVAGQAFPVILGADYNRDPQGRIIVDPITGYPSPTSEIKVLGNAQPKHILALNLSARYKSFTLSGVAEYRGGYSIYNAAGTTYDFSGSSAVSAFYNRDRFVIPNSSYLDAATGEYVANTNITVRDGGPNYWTAGSPRTDIDVNYVYSGAFWKVRELALAYDLPASLLGKTKAIKGARVSVQGRNLFLWTPNSNQYTDPEYSDGDATAGSSGNAIGLTNLGQTPPSRYFGATVSLTF